MTINVIVPINHTLHCIEGARIHRFSGGCSYVNNRELHDCHEELETLGDAPLSEVENIINKYISILEKGVEHISSKWDERRVTAQRGIDALRKAKALIRKDIDFKAQFYHRDEDIASSVRWKGTKK